MLSATIGLDGSERTRRHRRFSPIASLEKQVPRVENTCYLLAHANVFVYPSSSLKFGHPHIDEGTNTSMILNTRFTITSLSPLLQLHTALSLPSISLISPSLSLVQDPAASNLSKPMYPTPYTQLQALTNIPSASFETFPIPNTDLILNFSHFEKLVDIFEMDDLLHNVQDNIQSQIDRHGAQYLAPDDEYGPWRTDHTELEFCKASENVRLTLGQFRSMVEGLVTYMVFWSRSREATFRLLRKGEISSTILAGGAIWMI